MSDTRIPKLRYHRATNQHYVWHNSKRQHMGSDPDAAKARYEVWKAELLSARRTASERTSCESQRSTGERHSAGGEGERTVAEVLLEYSERVLSTCTDRATVNRFRRAVVAVAEAGQAALPASGFRGPQLKAVRSHLLDTHSEKIGARLSRTYINHLVAAVQQAWRWALSEDLVSAAGAATIAAVKPLGRGRGGIEPQRVLPPAAGWDEALVELPTVLAVMVQVQALCGMRPQDVCRMKRGELSTAPSERVKIPGTTRTTQALKVEGRAVWVFAPSEHKTSWKGKPRVVALGPKAQALLAPLLEGLGADDYIFSPARALEESKRGNRYKGKGYSGHYATRQYAQLVERAIERANRPRIRAGWQPEELVPEWTPNMLRHLAATRVGDELDREHARALLGQSSADVIDVYLEQQFGKAARAAAECG